MDNELSDFTLGIIYNQILCGYARRFDIDKLETLEKTLEFLETLEKRGLVEKEKLASIVSLCKQKIKEKKKAVPILTVPERYFNVGRIVESIRRGDKPSKKILKEWKKEVIYGMERGLIKDEIYLKMIETLIKIEGTR